LKQIFLTNQFLTDAIGLINKDPQAVIKQLKAFEQDTTESGVDPVWIEGLIEERKVAKAAKNWARADEIRKELTAMKVILKDNPDGSTSWKIQ
jgi:cysteinyl-tRNA synthetase